MIDQWRTAATPDEQAEVDALASDATIYDRLAVKARKARRRLIALYGARARRLIP